MHLFLRLIGEDQQLEKIVRNYEINRPLAQRLKQLRGYEIVIVCDDSGSMKTSIHNKQQTRWQYLMNIVLKVLDIAVIFDSNGVDIYFLNSGGAEAVKDPSHVRELFAEEPSGYTPLVPVLEEVFRLPAAAVGHEKKLLVFVATDGAPTDDHGKDQTEELKKLMNEKRNTETTFVQFLACTDDPAQTTYLADWDRTMKNVDVTRDFYSERVLFQRKFGNNRSFSEGDYVVKALLGAIDSEIDDWNEP